MKHSTSFLLVCFCTFNLTIINVSASIHDYKNEQFIRKSNAFFFHGGTEGLYASKLLSNASPDKPLEGKSFIRFEDVVFLRTKESANAKNEMQSRTGLIETIILEVRDREKIGDAFSKSNALCCTPKLAQEKFCTVGEVIIRHNEDNPLWPVRIQTFFEGKNQEANMLPKSVEINSTGMYYLYFMFCDPELKGTIVRGRTVWKNPDGYLPGRMVPLMTFYGLASLAYLVLGLFWFLRFVQFWKDVIQLHYQITAVIALGMSEMALWYFEYANLNATGSRPMVITVWAVTMTAVKKTLSRVLLLVVSMGYGVVRPTLGGVTSKAFILALTYFIATEALELVEHLGSINDFSRKTRIYLVLPVVFFHKARVLFFSFRKLAFQFLIGRKMMKEEAVISDPVDPLHGLIGLPLLPNTTRVSTLSVEPKDLESIHNFIKSMETKSPGLLEDARAIVDNSAELVNTKFPSFIQSMGIDWDLTTKGKEKLQERRPGLGRKRARFSLKPSTSQPPISLAPLLDIDQLSDPVEFYAVSEKLEDAVKEIKRQNGSIIHDPDMNNPLANARRRRPGILGKSVKYKHRFSTQPENDDAFISSQETLEHDILDEHGSQLLEELPGFSDELQESDFTGSIKETENRVNIILDDLLSGSGEDLEGDMVAFKLQQRLQIKPIELGTLCMPEFPVTGKPDGKAFGERIHKPRKFSLGIQDLVRSATEGTPSTHKQHEVSPASSLASPTPPKSPFASLSLLKKKIMQSNPLRDPFSPLNIDLHSEHPNWSAKMKSQSVNNNVGPTESHGETENLAGGENTNIMIPLRGSDFEHEQLMEKNSGRDSVKTGPSGSLSGMEQRNGLDDIDFDDIDVNTNVNLNMRNMDSHHESDGLDKVKDDSVINSVLKDQQGLETESYINCQQMQDVEVFAEKLPSLQAQGKADDTANCTIETAVEDFRSAEIDQQVDNRPPETVHSAEHNHHLEDSVKDLNGDQLNSVAVEVPSTELRSKFPETSPQHHAQENAKQQKAKRPAVGRRERKTLSSRPSIADAGTSFESGVRRSKRTKTRPLQYWKGERLLYGRVNESLKLVGLKYISPGKGSIKVKSYIPDDYKDLVELAARH